MEKTFKRDILFLFFSFKLLVYHGILLDLLLLHHILSDIESDVHLLFMSFQFVHKIVISDLDVFLFSDNKK